MGVVGETQKQSPEGEDGSEEEGRIRDHHGNLSLIEEQRPVVATG